MKTKQPKITKTQQFNIWIKPILVSQYQHQLNQLKSKSTSLLADYKQERNAHIKRPQTPASV